jgi:hypothetical protein
MAFEGDRRQQVPVDGHLHAQRRCGQRRSDCRPLSWIPCSWLDAASFEQLVMAYPQRSSSATTHDDPAPGGAAQAEPEGGHKVIWVSWRQYRSQAIACLALLAALAIYAIVMGISMCAAFSNDHLAGCLARSHGMACPTAVTAFMNEFSSAVNVAFWSVALIVPGLIGVLVGGPASKTAG